MPETDRRLNRFQGMLLEDDRVPGLQKQVTTVETKLATIPTVPTEAGTYKLGIDAEGKGTFNADALPALPTEAGDYKLVVTVAGEVVSYAWATIV